MSLPGVAPARLPRPPRPEADHLVTRADLDGLRALLGRCRAPGEAAPLSWRSCGPVVWRMDAGERAGLEELLERWERAVEDRAGRGGADARADRGGPAGAVPRPAGLEELELEDGGGVYLIDAGDEHKYRVLGWYYGYPACCVEAFIDRRERLDAEHREWLERQPWDGPMLGTPDDPRPEPADRPAHPVSGHLLCPACEAGPPAPLPPRPAAAFGWAEVSDDGELLLTPPSAWRPS